MFATELNPTALISRQWIANEYVATDLIFIARRDEEWIGGYKPHIMQMQKLSEIIGEGIEFIDLADTPDTMGDPGQILQVNDTGDKLEFVDPLERFLELVDTPSSYTGSADYLVVVNPTEDGLIFQEPPLKDSIYEARVLFDTTNNPTVSIILEDNFPATVTFTRENVGIYRATFSNSVNNTKLVTYINNSDTGIFYISQYNNLFIEYSHKDFTGTLSDVNYNLSLEIKLKP